MSEKRRRIQRRRTKGWRMPEGAVYVGRPTKWGNPFRVYRTESRPCMVWAVIPDGLRTPAIYHLEDERDARTLAVELFRLHTGLFGVYRYDAETFAELRRELGGRDLACWCPPDSPCHADVLLDLADAGQAP